MKRASRKYPENGSPPDIRDEVMRDRKANKGLSGQVPAGHVRLNANIRKDLHTRIKIEAVRQSKTIGQLIEEWIERYTPKL
jgi:predicted HicB family RNase H-like nuclease